MTEKTTPDMIARGMSWDDTLATMKECCAQAGVQWDEEKQPKDIAINVMQRIANTAHKAGFNLAKLRLTQWAIKRWYAEVANRPLNNIHRRTLDDTWRQVLRCLDVNDQELLGPKHDDLIASAAAATPAQTSEMLAPCLCDEGKCFDPYNERIPAAGRCCRRKLPIAPWPSVKQEATAVLPECPYLDKGHRAVWKEACRAVFAAQTGKETK